MSRTRSSSRAGIANVLRANGFVVSEKMLQSQVTNLARMCGWMVFHDTATNTHRRCPKCAQLIASPRNAPGFPDLVLCRPPRLVFAELKVGKNTLSPHQERWRDALLAAGCEWYLWTDATDMQEIGEMLAAARGGGR